MKATLYAVANRSFEALAGAVTLALIGIFFTPEQQGYYYTFVGLLTLQTLVDLGLGSVIQPFASHEWAAPAESSRLASLVKLGARWYAVAGSIVAVGMCAGGVLYFGAFADDGALAWRHAWFSASLLTGLGMLLTPALAILEGTDRVERVYRAKLAQSLAGRTAGWLAIATGLGLFAIPVMRLASILAGLGGIGRAGLRFLANELRRASSAQAISWSREIWPLQWRVAVSSAGGYLLFSLFTPVLFAAHGAEVAGRMGMTLSAAMALGSAAFAFVGTRQPRLAILAARGDFAAMDHVFRKAVGAAVAFAFVGSLAFLSLLLAAPGIGARFLGVGEAALLLTGMVLQQIRFAMGSYLRAHKEEPYAGLFALEGLLALVVLAPLGTRFGSLGMVSGFLLLTAVMLVPAAIIFGRCRSTWHASPLVSAT